MGVRQRSLREKQGRKEPGAGCTHMSQMLESLEKRSGRMHEQQVTPAAPERMKRGRGKTPTLLPSAML